MKHFVKVKNQEKAVFSYLREKFPRLSEAKSKEGHWSTNTRHYHGRILRTLLQGNEKADSDRFKFAVKGFLGDRRAQNY